MHNGDDDNDGDGDDDDDNDGGDDDKGASWKVNMQNLAECILSLRAACTQFELTYLVMMMTMTMMRIYYDLQ